MERVYRRKKYRNFNPASGHLNADSRSGVDLDGTTANEGTRGSLVRMIPDVVYYSWAAFDTSI